MSGSERIQINAVEDGVLEKLADLGGSRSIKELWEAGVVVTRRTGSSLASKRSIKQAVATLVEKGILDKLDDDRPNRYRIPARFDEPGFLAMIEAELDRMAESGELECRVGEDGIKRYWPARGSR